MKKTDIAMIVLIAGLAVLTAFLVARNILIAGFRKGRAGGYNQSISDKVESPDQNVFNSNAINPTVETFIGDKTLPQ